MKTVYRPRAQREHIVGQFVYRMFDPTGALLYIGTCSDITARLMAHETASPFYDPESTAVDLEEPAGSRHVAEAEAIRTEHPRWNVLGRDHANHPDGPARSWLDVAMMHPGTYRPHVRYWDFDQELARRLSAVTP